MPVRLFIAFILLALPLSAEENGESSWFYRSWQTVDGLPDNSVSGITQTPDGYLWIGTNGGAIRFNGSEFKALSLRTVPNLPSRQAHVIFKDRVGNLWLGMERGPVLRIGKDSFKAFDKSDGLFNRRITDITEDQDGRIWVSYASGVCFIENEQVHAFGRKDNVPVANQTSLTTDSNGQIWMTSDSALAKLDQDGFHIRKEFGTAHITLAAAQHSGLWLTHQSQLFHLENDSEPKLVSPLPHDCSITSLFEDQQGAVWIGTLKKGLFRFSEGRLEYVPTSHHAISSIYEDREKNIWVGTNGGGLNLILPRTAHLTGPSSGLPFPSVRSTACDSSGRIWATSLNGQLGYRESGQWHLFENLPEDVLVNCVTSDQQGQLWLGTRNHGLLKINSDRSIFDVTADSNLSSSPIRSIFSATNGDLWFVLKTPSQLFVLRNEIITRIAKPVKLGPIRAMAETSDGTLWLGASDGHLFRLEGQKIIDESSLDGPINFSIRTLHATPDNSLWIGYAGEGLGHLKDGTLRRFTTEDGLYDDYLSQIQHDDNGGLWIASNRGLFQVRLEHLLSESSHLYCQIYGRSKSLPSIQPSRDFAPSSSRDQDGRLYFSTHNGLLEVQPGDPGNIPEPPPVIIEKITLNGEQVGLFKRQSLIPESSSSQITDLSEPDPQLTIPPDHDNLVISFAALNFTNPENTLIRYRLHPLDEKWQEVENQHQVNFAQLPAGKYRFQVIASNGAGAWNHTGASINLTIEPFFWETWWFKSAIAILTAVLAGGFVFLSLRRKHRLQLQNLAATRAMEQERSRIARDIHDDLGASLTHIALLSQTSPHPEDQTTHTAFSQIQSTTRHLMRSMDGVVWAINPEHDSFDDLASYLSTYAQEFLNAAGIRCRLGLPVDLPEHLLSAQLRHNLLLAFKEALNNIVKYAKATEVRISLQPEHDFFILKIQDDGGGIDPNAPADPGRPNAGKGMANMESRMQEIGGSCLFQSDADSGTTVEFKVPFKSTS